MGYWIRDGQLVGDTSVDAMADTIDEIDDFRAHYARDLACEPSKADIRAVLEVALGSHNLDDE